MKEQSNCNLHSHNHACGCGCSHDRIKFKDSENIPQQIKCKQDNIASAQDAIDAAFDFFKNPKAKEPEAKIIQELGLPNPKDFQTGEISDEFVSRVAEKILEKFDGRLAIIKGRKDYCYPKEGETIEYLIYDTSVDDKYKDLPKYMRDGVIKDLEGVIEVVPGVISDV